MAERGAVDGVSSHSIATSPRTVTTAVPEAQLVSIEHPCVVTNVSLGFQSLGGEQQVKHILDDDSNKTDRPRRAQKQDQSRPILGVSLRPQDPLAKKLESAPTPTHGLLVKVTVPKWTGRKRKRGSDEPFTADTSSDNSHAVPAPQLVRRLRDHADTFHVEVVGKVETSHRFDSLPDLHVHDQDVPVMQQLRQHAVTPSYDVLKNFRIGLTPNAAGITPLPRPPRFIPPDFDPDDPFELGDTIQDGSEFVVKGLPPKTTNKEKLVYKPGAEMPARIKPAAEAVLAFFEKRPIATRLVLGNSFPDLPIWRVDTAATWAGAKAKEGPWKDCVVKHGVDPTTDPQYRIYQIIAVRPMNSKAKEDSTSHIFDGVTKMKGRSFQFCDITDPVFDPIVNTPHYRSKADGYGGPLCGWYWNGTIAKLRILMADKLRRMHTPDATVLDERAYLAVATLPDKIEESTRCEVDGMLYGAEAKSMAGKVRAEALRLAGLLGEKGANDNKNSEAREEALTGEEAIDPMLMEGNQDVSGTGQAPTASEQQSVEG